MKYLEALYMRDIDAGALCGRGASASITIKVRLPKEVLSDQVREVQVTNLLAKTMEAVWVVRSYHQCG